MYLWGVATRIGVIADTHIPMKAKQLPETVFVHFSGVDYILHAGDVMVGDVIRTLESIAPTYGVLGNMDPMDLQAKLLPTRRAMFLGGIEIGMVHDSGSSAERRARMKREFAGCRVVVFGHSHQPLIDDDGELLLLNPGSACDPRAAKVPTVALLEIDDGKPTARLIQL